MTTKDTAEDILDEIQENGDIMEKLQSMSVNGRVDATSVEAIKEKLVEANNKLAGEWLALVKAPKKEPEPEKKEKKEAKKDGANASVPE